MFIKHEAMHVFIHNVHTDDRGIRRIPASHSCTSY